jgi:hypothetical protein
MPTSTSATPAHCRSPRTSPATKTPSSTPGVIGRLHRLAARLTDELVAVYAEHGLTEGEFDVLATLRRAGAPYERSGGEPSDKPSDDVAGS